MMHDHFREALESANVPLVRKLAAHLFPHLPPPKSDAEAEIVMHIARTAGDNIMHKCRAYSHAWLMERGLPSQLPQHMRKKAEQMYPITVKSVGISVKGSSELGRQVAPLIRGAMEDAVIETYADGYADQPQIVKSRMLEKRSEAVKKLLGKVT